ncbi:Hint domain-containing protein [Paracoccus aerodenitrificans]|uniref:Hint domain-containing protein n=1 Tax=Paracoccus aerodenitrificans TaxID=3017781 RepID=UPI0022F10965|nr:Hint domain-containing protein [Paracoccus aerodenitrificans]WBU64987.1 Hint domain-containing protein [Paracoccus aerodenitrificans]
MADATYRMLYLGDLLDMDTDEDNNSVADDPAGIFDGQTFGSTSDPLFSELTAVTLNDPDDSEGAAFDHNQVGENVDTITYTLNGTEYVLQADSGVIVEDVQIVQLTGKDPVTGANTYRTITADVRILQDESGNAFIIPPLTDNPNETELDLVEFPIISITIPANATYDTGPFGQVSTDRNELPFNNGYVDGTDAGELISAGYYDADGDFIDENDSILDYLTGDGDHVLAGLGDDTVYAGQGADSVEGGGGDDELYGNFTGEDASTDADTLDGGSGDDELYGMGGSDSLLGGAGEDQLDGGAGADELEGGDGFDTFIAGEGDTISDFNTGTGQNFNNGNIQAGTGQDDNDFVDLSGYYTVANMNQYNADNGTNYKNPLQWMRADQADGVLDNPDGLNLTINNGGSPVNPLDLTWDNTNVACFASDAKISTATGEVCAGELVLGDLVETRDAGSQPIRWIGKRYCGPDDFADNPRLRPIRIRKGALAPDLPQADLLVSPQHRMLIRSKIAMRMFGANEVLVAAKQLCQVDGVDIAEDLDEVTYVHFLLNDHQIVLANGAETESLYTGEEAMKSVGPTAAEEIFTLFPELRDFDECHAVRIIAPGRMGRRLALRHKNNEKPLVN